MSTPNAKPRVIKDFDKLDQDIQEQSKRVSALPFETEEKHYLVRMTIEEAQQIIEDDDDYDGDGNLKDEIKEEYEDKHEDGSDPFDEDDNIEED